MPSKVPPENVRPTGSTAPPENVAPIVEVPEEEEEAEGLTAGVVTTYASLTTFTGGAVAFIPLPNVEVQRIRYFLSWNGNDDEAGMTFIVDNMNADGTNHIGGQFNGGSISGADEDGGSLAGTLDLTAWDGRVFTAGKILRVQIALSDLFSVSTVRVGLAVEYVPT